MPEQKKAPEDPRVDSFKIFVKLKGTLKDVGSKLSTLSFMEVVIEKDKVNAAYIESRDIEKMPYTFALFKFKNACIEVLYSIPPTIPPKKRKFEIVRYFLNLLTILGPTYSIESSVIYQLLDGAYKEMNDFVSLDYNRLYMLYDNIKKDYEDVSRRCKRTMQELEEFKRENYELKTKNDEFILRIKQLETLSDETLKQKIQEWISEHSGEINITEFSKFYRISEMRVEEMLNALVREGYVQPLQ